MPGSHVVPTKLLSNQFDHFYKGGDRIGKLRKGPGGPMRPEEWIGSTTTRFGQELTGLSYLTEGELLRDSIEADPIAWLGAEHVGAFGSSTEILVKLLDLDQRLPVHYHPDQKFAAERLQINHGKTEAWIILEAPQGAKVGLGFNREMSKSEIANLVAAHDSQALLESLVFTEVSSGDAIFVPAGVPHAIESGIFVLELQEPSDLSILLEWNDFAVDGDIDGHLDLGFDSALDALRLTPLSAPEKNQAFTRFEEGEPVGHAIFNSVADPFFRADYLAGNGERVGAGFGIFLCLWRAGTLDYEGSSPMPVDVGDAVVIPHIAGDYVLNGASGVLCRPPVPQRSS